MYLLQRKKGPQGKGLGKTSGWVHRASLNAKGVQQLSGVNYERIDDDGLHITFGSDRSSPRVLEVDNVVICAGQESVRDLEDALRARGIEPHVIGGAAVAAELDAKRAIKQGTELAARLWPLRILQAPPISLSVNHHCGLVASTDFHGKART